ncbi:alkaline phosphatase-like protein [Ascodesmis nigricans]|uniref:Alkaline phosphatase-like protein n=1 Tax=Ascodesmis nigricans TaxID=341454 RepID=A0A4S2MQR2_9PEZI|nr:alkaline phosphatase-like protein [Ascodesmis nigricans]
MSPVNGIINLHPPTTRAIQHPTLGKCNSSIYLSLTHWQPRPVAPSPARLLSYSVGCGSWGWHHRQRRKKSCESSPERRQRLTDLWDCDAARSRTMRLPLSSLSILAAAGSTLLLLIPTTVADASAGTKTPASETPGRKPNILFLFNDDQDKVLAGLDFVPSIKRRVQDEGFTFENHYATVALCCPARVALLRGQQAHNTNITFVMPPGGAYEKFVASEQDRECLPQWLKRAGYHTEYIGKLMNGYGVMNYENVPKGWDHFDGLLDPYTYIYNTPVWSSNGKAPKFYPRAHQTDVLRAKAVTRLKRLLQNKNQPWFLEVAGVAPHQQFNQTGSFPPVPAVRHMKEYEGLKAPRTPNFNPDDDEHRKPAWVGELKQMDENQIAFSDTTYQARAQAMMGLDEMFNELLDVLEEAGELDNTYIIMTSDNGYHVGQHRVPAGKTLPYKEDTNVPFVIRGPGIPKGLTGLPSSHVDIAPTLLDIIGVPSSSWPTFFDGRSLLPYLSRTSSSPLPEVINIEYWGGGLDEQTMAFSPLNTYKTVRLIGPTYSYLYTHWCTSETELYDTHSDPFELTPIPLTANPRLYSRLNALLLVTKSCAKESCKSPWKTLHPDGTVLNLPQAMDPKYDPLYNALPQVAFKKCLDYQHVDNEVPYHPPLTPGSLGADHRNINAGHGIFAEPRAKVGVKEIGYFGETYEGFEAYERRARYLTEEEMGRKDEAKRWKGWKWYWKGNWEECRIVFWRTVGILWYPRWWLDVDYL